MENWCQCLLSIFWDMREEIDVPRIMQHWLSLQNDLILVFDINLLEKKRQRVS